LNAERKISQVDEIMNVEKVGGDIRERRDFQL
jgi:hypothetical protein